MSWWRSTISWAPPRFGYEAALADGIVKKVLSPITWPLPSYFGALRPYCPDGKSILIAMIAEPSLESFRTLLGDRGAIMLEMPTDDSPGQVPLYEYTWNHTTLQVLKSDRSVTYLQCLIRTIACSRRSPKCASCFRMRCCNIWSSFALAAASPVAVCRSCVSRCRSSQRDHRAARTAGGLYRQSTCLHGRGRQPLQARRGRSARVQAGSRSVWSAQSGKMRSFASSRL